MIIVRLCGGLGNQLFQYAVGRRLADIHQTELVLNLEWYARTPSACTPRAYELVNYRIRARSATALECLNCYFQSRRLLCRIPLLPSRLLYIREDSRSFDSAVLCLPDNTYLDGYWQSFRYFDDAADMIRADFTPLIPLGRQDEKIATLIEPVDSVSVHVRRGDYVTNPVTAKAHGQCSLSYYQAALNYIYSRTTWPHFFVFSDDPIWCRENLSLPGPVTFVEHNGPATAFQDLRLMALCKHHIIANSSFSWWGAWLSTQPNKIVVSPRQWFSCSLDIASLIPHDWTRV